MRARAAQMAAVWFARTGATISPGTLTCFSWIDCLAHVSKSGIPVAAMNGSPTARVVAASRRRDALARRGFALTERVGDVTFLSRKAGNFMKKSIIILLGFALLIACGAQGQEGSASSDVATSKQVPEALATPSAPLDPSLSDLEDLSSLAPLDRQGTWLWPNALSLRFSPALSLPSTRSCGLNRCGPGEFCCNESCGICAPVGGFCTQQVCGPSSVPPTRCGPSVCGPGEFCCNESCGICAPVGGFCTQQVCGPSTVPPTRCGANVCGPGEFCCNESCGICAPVGGFCTQQVCP
ncbi:MAG: hypothetical protein K0S65_1875, partial [Labilithrix sp.]|nr:hypothetical protein [Labilithrix sp.]